MDDQPATETRGSLEPPPRKPPATVGASTPPSPVPRRPSFPHRHPALRRPALVGSLLAVVNGALDVVDAVVERVEDAVRR